MKKKLLKNSVPVILQYTICWSVIPSAILIIHKFIQIFFYQYIVLENLTLSLWIYRTAIPKYLISSHLSISLSVQWFLPPKYYFFTYPIKHSGNLLLFFPYKFTSTFLCINMWFIREHYTTGKKFESASKHLFISFAN